MWGPDGRVPSSSTQPADVGAGMGRLDALSAWPLMADLFSTALANNPSAAICGLTVFAFGSLSGNPSAFKGATGGHGFRAAMGERRIGSALWRCLARGRSKEGSAAPENMGLGKRVGCSV